MEKSDKTMLILLSVLIALPVLYYGTKSFVPKDPAIVTIVDKTIAEIRNGNLPNTEEVLKLHEELPAVDYQLIRGEINQQMNQTSYEEMVKHINGDLLNYLESQTVYPLDRYTVEFSQDTLTLKDSVNEKPFATINIDLNFYYQPKGSIEEDQGEIVEFSRAAKDEIYRSTYGLEKVNRIIMKYYDLEGSFRDSFTTSKQYKSGEMELPVSDKEITTQTLAFDYVGQIDQSFGTKTLNQNHNSTLKRFGIAPDSDTLLVEIALYAVEDEADKPIINDNMERIATELAQQLKEHPDTQTYLAENQAKNIAIAFYTPWQQEMNHEFSFAL